MVSSTAITNPSVNINAIAPVISIEKNPRTPPTISKGRIFGMRDITIYLNLLNSTTTIKLTRTNAINKLWVIEFTSERFILSISNAEPVNSNVAMF